VEIIEVDSARLAHLLRQQEGHFLDFKGTAISPAKLTKAISAFGNADGGELFVGVDETSPGVFEWNGFARPEDANAHVAVFEDLYPSGAEFQYELLSTPTKNGLVLHITVLKSQRILDASGHKIYIRRGAQSLPVDGEEALARLRRTKGLVSHEDETLTAPIEIIVNSVPIISFMLSVVPSAEPSEWLKKQLLIVNDRPTVAGVLLFSEEPQAVLPKAGIKIYRYLTSDEGTRETMDGDPFTVEGDLYNQIAAAVAKTVALTELVQRLGEHGMESIQYPPEALHEVITNAVLHRDYALNDDVHVRIYDNRIEVESPGKLPAHITVKNILKERFSRNPKIVRLINKFPNPPNKDVGEGLNTAFEAMAELQLRKPEIVESENSVRVVIRHEALASPEQRIMEHLRKKGSISNREARLIAPGNGEQVIRRSFKRLVDANQIEVVPNTSRGTTRYQLVNRAL
jgi:ATP-dependent DNA helicase RecG